MIAPQVGRLLLEQRHEQLRWRLSRIASRNEDGINSRQLPEDLAPFTQRELDRRRIAIVLVECRIPDPDIETILITDPRHLDHHAHRRQRKMGTVTVVIGPWRHQLDRIGSPDRQIANILLPHRDIPGIIGVGLRSVAELMAPQRILWRGGYIEWDGQRDTIRRHFESPQQMADPKENSTRIVAADRYLLLTGSAAGSNRIALGRTG